MNVYFSLSTMKDTYTFSKSFYIDHNLFATYEPEVRTPRSIGVFNNVRIVPVTQLVLDGWANDIRQHAKQRFRYGFLAFTAVAVACIAINIFTFPIGAIIGGTIGLTIFTPCAIKSYLESKKIKPLRERFTEQQALKAQNYFAYGPIKIIEQKVIEYNLAHRDSPPLLTLSENLDLVNPGTFTQGNLQPLESSPTSTPLELFKRCFIYQQTHFDGVKKGTFTHQSVAQLQDVVINWFKGIDTPNVLAYCNLIIHPLNEEAVKACAVNYLEAPPAPLPYRIKLDGED